MFGSDLVDYLNQLFIADRRGVSVGWLLSHRSGVSLKRRAPLRLGQSGQTRFLSRRLSLGWGSNHHQHFRTRRKFHRVGQPDLPAVRDDRMITG